MFCIEIKKFKLERLTDSVDELYNINGSADH